MNGLFKKVVAGATTVAVLATLGISAFAQTEMSNMVLAGYDTTNPDAPNRIYNEVIDGHYTNKQILVPVEATWKNEGFEAVYPYAGYDRMYLDARKQNITRYNNIFPQWETRRRNYMWEIVGGHKIWERQQTKVDGKTWKWDFGSESFRIPDSSLLTTTRRNAYLVNQTWKDYGFGKYNNNGNILTLEEQAMYSDFNINAVNDWNYIVNYGFTPEKLSARDELGAYTMSDAYLASLIPVVVNKYVTAKFEANSNEGLATKNVADEYKIHKYDGWTWDADSFGIVNTASVAWTTPGYEMAEPYNYYQYMIVNGVVMDGKLDANGIRKDRIYRYTGGKASPSVTWKFVFFQNAKDATGNIINDLYEVVEQKYINGVAAYDVNGDPIYRIPTSEYGNTFFALRGKTIEYWVVDKAGNSTLLGKTDNFEGSIGGLIDAFTSGNLYVGSGIVAPEEGKTMR